MRFYDREKEVEILKNISANFRIAVMGRRRVGKTRLVEETYKDCITFFVPAEKTEKEIINGWCEEYNELNLPRVESFKEFFNFVFNYLNDKVIFIDEIQNFLKVNKSFFFDLQRLIDRYKPKLVVTGSLISTMKKIIQDEKQPLYGRFDYIIKLRELGFETIYGICRDLNIGFEDTIKLYSVFGGIPKYYETIEKIRWFNFKRYIKQMFVFYHRPLYEDVKVMLKEEFGKEYKMFFSILSAIARGINRQSEIAGFVGKKQTSITKYLNMLKDDFEIIKRISPVIGGKKGVYIISNNIFEFWFDNIWRYNYFIETEEESKLENIFDKRIDPYIGKKFEDLIFALMKRGLLKFNNFKFTKIGKQWGRIKGKPKGQNTYEIDILAINEKSKEILACECKWQSRVNAERIAKQLVEKLDFVEWHKDKSKESLAIFAKSFSKRIKSYEGKKVYCFDLRALERVFKRNLNKEKRKI